MVEQSPEASQAGSSMKLSECAVPWIYFFLAEWYYSLPLFFFFNGLSDCTAKQIENKFITA